MGLRLLRPYVPYLPHPKQALFLSDAINGVEEVLYGGAAGGGKSDALLMAALQFVDVPDYAALILRKTFRQLKQPGSMLNRAHLWLRRTMYVEAADGTLRRMTTADDPRDGKSLVDWGLCHWNAGDYRYEFKSGATITFGHLQTDDDWENYQGPEYQFIGIDELTQHNEEPVQKLQTRLRQPEGPADLDERERLRAEMIAGETPWELWAVPLRFRAGTNPGGRGHSWVKRRYVGDAKKNIKRSQADARFISAKLEDNPSLGASYEAQLAKADPVTFRQMRHGSWDDMIAGELFQRGWYDKVEEWEVRGIKWQAGPIRYWDLAATEEKTNARGTVTNNPDWAVGAKMAYDGYHWYILDIVRVRNEPATLDKAIDRVAMLDGTDVEIIVEQEPGASGKMVVNTISRRLARYSVQGHRPTGSKEVRARVVSSKVVQRLVRVVEGAWNTVYFEEAEDFPNGDHDDQVDAVSGAFDRLGVAGEATTTDGTQDPDELDADDPFAEILDN